MSGLHCADEVGSILASIMCVTSWRWNKWNIYHVCVSYSNTYLCWVIAECSLGKNSWASATIVKIMPTVISCYEYFILDGMRRIESWFWQLDKCEHVLTLTLKLGIFTKYLFFCFLNTSLRLHLKKNVHVTETWFKLFFMFSGPLKKRCKWF